MKHKEIGHARRCKLGREKHYKLKNLLSQRKLQLQLLGQTAFLPEATSFATTTTSVLSAENKKRI
jgi:hypothetical protein